MKSDYMILPKGPYRVPLYPNEEDRTFYYNGQVYVLPEHLERQWVYWTYQQQDGKAFLNTVRSLRLDFSFHNAAHLNVLEKWFREKHPAIPIDHYSLEDVPLYADEGSSITLLAYTCPISASEEEYLMNMVRKVGNSSVIESIAEWFRESYVDPRLMYEAGYNYQASFKLAYSFLMQHGIYFKYPYFYHHPQTFLQSIFVAIVPDKYYDLSPDNRMLANLFLCECVVAVWFGLIKLFEWIMDDTDSLLLFFLALFAFIYLFSTPVRIFLDKLHEK